jgi:hypothetical protein
MVHLPVLNIIHCMLHYVDLNSATSQPINGDLLRVIAKYIEVNIGHGTSFQKSHPQLVQSGTALEGVAENPQAGGDSLVNAGGAAAHGARYALGQRHLRRHPAPLLRRQRTVHEEGVAGTHHGLYVRPVADAGDRTPLHRAHRQGEAAARALQQQPAQRLVAQKVIQQ